MLRCPSASPRHRRFESRRMVAMHGSVSIQIIRFSFREPFVLMREGKILNQNLIALRKNVRLVERKAVEGTALEECVQNMGA